MAKSSVSMDTTAFISCIHVFLILVAVYLLPPSSSSSVDEFLKCLAQPPLISESLCSSPTKAAPSFSTGRFNQSMTTVPPPIFNYVYTPQTPDAFYSTLRAYIRNSRFNRSSTPKPAAIVTAMHYSHVQSTVVCAKSSGLQLRIRSGGHDFEGMSYVSTHPFVLLDMFRLRAIQLDIPSRTAWVQSGATLGELSYVIAEDSRGSLGFPSGVCPTVGVGGFFGGAGYGAMIRKYGMSVDHITDAQVVDANGRILDRESMGEDLFWAIRGGGASSFCVVLSWKINLVPVPQPVTVFSVLRTLDEGLTDIVEQWQRVAPRIDHELFIRAEPIVVSKSSVQGSSKKTAAVRFIALYLGDAKALLRIVDEWFPLLGLRESDTEEMSWAQSTLFWNYLPVSTTPLELLLERPITSNSYNKRRSDFVKEPIPREGLEVLWKKLIELENISMQWNPYGGIMSEIEENATPYPHRAGNLFKMQYHTVWEEEDKEEGGGVDGVGEVEKGYLKATNELYETLTPYVSREPRGGFLNYRDMELGSSENGGLESSMAAYFKDNARRLLRVKAMVDPENFFRYEQSIPLVETSTLCSLKHFGIIICTRFAKCIYTYLIS